MAGSEDQVARKVGELTESVRSLNEGAFGRLAEELRRTNQRLAQNGVGTESPGSWQRSTGSLEGLLAEALRKVAASGGGGGIGSGGKDLWRAPQADAVGAAPGLASGQSGKAGGAGQWAATAAGDIPELGGPDAAGKKPVSASTAADRYLGQALASMALGNSRGGYFGTRTLMANQLQASLGQQGWFQQISQQFSKAGSLSGFGIGGDRTWPQVFGLADMYTQAQSGGLSPLSGALQGFALGGPVGAVVGLGLSLFGGGSKSSKPKSQVGKAYNAPQTWDSAPYLYNLSMSGGTSASSTKSSPTVIVNLQDYSGNLGKVARDAGAAIGRELANDMAFAKSTISTAVR